MTTIVEVGASASPRLSVPGFRWPARPQAPGPWGRRRPSPWVEKACALWLPESVCASQWHVLWEPPAAGMPVEWEFIFQPLPGSRGKAGAWGTCPSPTSKLGEAPCFHVPESGVRGAPTKPWPPGWCPHVGLGSHIPSFSNHLSLGLILNIYIFLEGCPFHWSSSMCDSSWSRGTLMFWGNLLSPEAPSCPDRICTPPRPPSQRLTDGQLSASLASFGFPNENTNEILKHKSNFPLYFFLPF